MTIGALSSPVRTISLKARPSAVALAEADPADARGQALEGDALARHVEPVVQVRVVGDQLLHLGVGAVDVLGVARERRPAERADAAAEERADVGRHEAREGEGVGEALLQRHLADVVAVVDGRDAAASRSRPSPRRGPSSRRGRPSPRPWGRLSRFARHSAMRPALRQVAVDRIVGVVWSVTMSGRTPRRDELGEDVGGVAEQADGLRLARPRSSARSSPAPRRGCRRCSST